MSAPTAFTIDLKLRSFSQKPCSITCPRPLVCRNAKRRRSSQRKRAGRFCIEAQKTDTATILPPAPVAIPEGDWKVIDRGVTAPIGFQAAGGKGLIFQSLDLLIFRNFGWITCQWDKTRSELAVL